MNCTCINGCARCAEAPVNRQVFDCPRPPRIVRHEHVVRHHHDTINEFDVIHEHIHNTRDVINQREVTCHNDYRPYQPNYCGDMYPGDNRPPCGDGCNGAPPMRPRFWQRRGW